MTRALLFFAGVFLIGQVVIALLSAFGVPHLNAMGVVIYMVALSPPMMDFVKRERRVMTGGEKMRFALGAMLIALLPSLLLLALYDGGSVYRELAAEFGLQWRRGDMGTVGLFAVIAAALPLTLWVAAYFFAGMYGKHALVAQEKAGAAGPR
jgi:hypothetical protein